MSSFDSDILETINKRQKELDTLLKSMKKSEKDSREKELELRDEITDENCEQKVLNFIEKEMKIFDAKENIKLHRAHRLGVYRSTKVRPIVAKFAYFPDRERVRASAKTLSGTHFVVAEQFPREIMETRRKLVPIMKKAHDEGKEAYIKVDKLYINKQLYRGHD
ncbi:uncharacterized protein LOC132744721 [Ruditapes philippinarum]|uniref:uncharacterized protein LOC132744721 n=1 Tax=Ruditapes philippinarum TaxID=129788 RepID=UPI00295A759B|nr:uncharacterized protein LOC132744721 [Ruditapes philippinarum]